MIINSSQLLLRPQRNSEAVDFDPAVRLSLAIFEYRIYCFYVIFVNEVFLQIIKLDETKNIWMNVHKFGWKLCNHPYVVSSLQWLRPMLLP